MSNELRRPAQRRARFALSIVGRQSAKDPI